MLITYTAQILSALIMIYLVCHAVMVFCKMAEGTDERNSIPYLLVNIVIAACSLFVYWYLNYFMN